MKKRTFRCCLYCGRDTTATPAICSHCKDKHSSGNRGHRVFTFGKSYAEGVDDYDCTDTERDEVDLQLAERMQDEVGN